MPQEYELTSIQASTFKDMNNNFWTDGSFKGFGEPVKIVTPYLAKWVVGQKYYGTITTVPTRNDPNKIYYRFKREKRPEVPQNATEGANTNSKWQPRDDSAIQAQWAIRLSTEIVLALDPTTYNDDDVEAQAKRFMAMIARVKDGKPLVPAPGEEPIPEMPPGFGLKEDDVY